MVVSDSPSLYHLTSDILRIIFDGSRILTYRLICKRLKYSIENSTNLCINLSYGGGIHSTSSFYQKFKGKIDIKCRYFGSPNELVGLCQAIQNNVQSINSLTLTHLSDSLLDRFCRTSAICITFVHNTPGYFS